MLPTSPAACCAGAPKATPSKGAAPEGLSPTKLMIIPRDDSLTSLCRLAGIAFAGVGASPNTEILDIGFDQVHEFLRTGNMCARGGTVAVVLASAIAGAQAIGIAVDPPGDLDKARTLGKMRGLYEARRKDVGVWRLGTG